MERYVTFFTTSLKAVRNRLRGHSRLISALPAIATKSSGLLFALTLLALLPSTQGQAADLKVIRVGVASVGAGGKPISGGSIGSLAQTKGVIDDEFKQDGIRIEWSFFKGAGPAVNEALANKQLDFAFQGDLPAIIAKASGIKTKLILATDKATPTYLAVPANSSAHSIADLKGKKVAIFKGTNLQLAAIKVYEELGLTEKSFKTINMDKATTETALATRDIDAGWFGPEVFPLIDKGVARILYTTKGKSPRLVRQSHVLVTEEFEQLHPELVQRFINVILKEALWASDLKNRDEVLKIWAKSGVSYASFKQDWQGDQLKDRGSPLLDEFFISHYQEAANASLKYRLIRKPLDVTGWIEPKYVQKGLETLQLQNVWQPRDAQGQLLGTPAGTSKGATN